MPQTYTITTFGLDELDAKAQATAIEHCRDINVDEGSEWYDYTIDMAAEIADMLGIDTRVRKIRCGDGQERLVSAIGFSGFCSQGDGAYFEGTYQYKEDAVANVKAELPEESAIHEIARHLEEIQQRNACKVIADVKHRGPYANEGNTNIEVFHDDGDDLTDGTEAAVAEVLRDFMRWIYKTLEHEYEWRVEDEQIRETILANEYEFLQDGRHFDATVVTARRQDGSPGFAS